MLHVLPPYAGCMSKRAPHKASHEHAISPLPIPTAPYRPTFATSKLQLHIIMAMRKNQFRVAALCLAAALACALMGACDANQVCSACKVVRSQSKGSATEKTLISTCESYCAKATSSDGRPMTVARLAFAYCEKSCDILGGHTFSSWWAATYKPLQGSSGSLTQGNNLFAFALKIQMCKAPCGQLTTTPKPTNPPTTAKPTPRPTPRSTPAQVRRSSTRRTVPPTAKPSPPRKPSPPPDKSKGKPLPPPPPPSKVVVRFDADCAAHRRNLPRIEDRVRGILNGLLSKPVKDVTAKCGSVVVEVTVAGADAAAKIQRHVEAGLLQFEAFGESTCDFFLAPAHSRALLTAPHSRVRPHT